MIINEVKVTYDLMLFFLNWFIERF